VTGQRLLNEYPMLDFIWTDDGPELECLMPTEWFPIQVRDCWGQGIQFPQLKAMGNFVAVLLAGRKLQSRNRPTLESSREFFSGMGWKRIALEAAKEAMAAGVALLLVAFGAGVARCRLPEMRERDFACRGVTHRL
jgi:hypothetical protein